MTYIQRKDRHGLKTVDEFESRAEARRMLEEYRLSDASAFYYMSRKPCKDWNEVKK